MRKRITILLGIGLTFVMAFGVIGSGATFTAAKGASQTINIGTMSIVVTSPTPGAYFAGDTLVCPAVTVLTSTGVDTLGCRFTIASTGAITPTKVTLSVSTTTSGADVSKFYLDHSPWANWNTSLGGGLYGVPLNGTVDFTTGLPATTDEFVAWTNLGNGDMGNWVVLAYSFDAVQ